MLIAFVRRRQLTTFRSGRAVARLSSGGVKIVGGCYAAHGWSSPSSARRLHWRILGYANIPSLLSHHKERRVDERFMITCRIPVERGNELAKAGTLGSTVRSIMEDLKPEAAYFGDIEGGRGGYIVVNMDDASQIPALAEPLFLGLGATIQVHPVMTPEDLGKAGPAIEQAAKKYGQ